MQKKKEVYIDLKAMFQCLLIYYMLIWNGSSLLTSMLIFNPGLHEMLGALNFAIGISILMLREYNRIYRAFLTIGLLILFQVIYLRVITKGDVGIQAIFAYGSPVMITFLAFYVDEEKFPERFLKVVTALVVISILFYVVQIANLQLLRTVLKGYPNGVYLNDWNYDPPKRIQQLSYGKFIFSTSQREPRRNNGIYSEPGNYQTVLNSMVFMILFIPDFFKIAHKKRLMYFLIYAVAVVTTQSTSAYLCFVIIVSCFFVTYQKESSMSVQKKRIIGVILIGAFILSLDFSVNGEESFIYTAIIKKLMGGGDAEGLELNSSGEARIHVMTACTELMMKKPWGAGFKTTANAIYSISDDSAGAGIFRFGAAMGIFPLISFLVWSLRELLVTDYITIWGKIAFLYLFFNVMTAQTGVFWPIFTTVNLFFMIINQKSREEREKSEEKISADSEMIQKSS